MKNIIRKTVMCAVLFIGLTACENDGYEEFKQQVSATSAMNGEWYIDVIKASNNSVQVQHALHRTYDSNDGKMFIDDKKEGWYLKGKLNVNVPSLTFDTSKESNLLDPGTTFTITEGKILKNAGKSKTGVATDSIYFKAEFSYEPGVIYIHSGHRRTGFIEDDF